MGWYQTLHGPLTCPVCGQRTEDAEADLVVPLPPNDFPLSVAVGEPLGPIGVLDYDYSMVRLRERADPVRGRAILPWTCFNCLAQRWALAGLARVDGVARLVSLEACPQAPQTLEAADWIHGSIVADLVRGTPEAQGMPREGLLDEAQRRVLADLLVAQDHEPGPG